LVCFGTGGKGVILIGGLDRVLGTQYLQRRCRERGDGEVVGCTYTHSLLSFLLSHNEPYRSSVDAWSAPATSTAFSGSSVV
jgi:hypothetical protein